MKTEAIVLRSIRYGEADRILHLYTPGRGRMGAIAKGARRTRSRFGGRLEPFFRLELMLHEGRGDLATVTGASTVSGHPRLRVDGPAIAAASRASEGVLRLLDSAEPNPAAYNLLCRLLAALDDPVSRAGVASPAGGVAFRLKLALAAGLAPELADCARCGEADGLVAFAPDAGGVVCASCQGGGFALSADAHRFMVEAVGRPLVEAPFAEGPVLRQADRAVSELLEHHANVRLSAVAG